MENSFDRVRRETKALESRNNAGAGKLPLPSEFDQRVSSVVRSFVNSSQAERVQIASLFDDSHSDTFITFAERMASLAVRMHSTSPLLEGLAALVLEGGKFDERENIAALAPLYDAAVKLGLDTRLLFEEAAKLLPNVISNHIQRFPDRSPNDRSLKVMGFFEDNDEGGFLYRRAVGS